MVKKKELVVAVINDFMGAGGKTQDEEVEEITKKYTELLTPAKLDIYTPASVYHKQLRDGTDMIIYDFGGLLPGTSLMEDNSRRLIEWALDHPSCCIIVGSTFTYNHYVKYEMEEKGLDSVHNICVNDFMLDDENIPGFPVPQWFRDLHDLPYVDPYAEKKAKRLKKPGKSGK